MGGTVDANKAQGTRLYVSPSSFFRVPQRLDGLGAIHPQRSALENAVMYTPDAVDGARRDGKEPCRPC